MGWVMWLLNGLLYQWGPVQRQYECGQLVLVSFVHILVQEAKPAVTGS